MAGRKITESQRKAQKEYDKGWCFFTCRVQRDVGEKFKELLKSEGKNANKLLCEFVNKYTKQRTI